MYTEHSGRADIDTSLLDNSGVYTLTAENKHGEAEEGVDITILSDTSGPKFNSSVYSLQLFHGQSGSIKLGVTGKPLPIITVQPAREDVEVDGDVVSFRRVTPESGESVVGAGYCIFRFWFCEHEVLQQSRKFGCFCLLFP